MRISDWSSDVCSSDLVVLEAAAVPYRHQRYGRTVPPRECAAGDPARATGGNGNRVWRPSTGGPDRTTTARSHPARRDPGAAHALPAGIPAQSHGGPERSEEHTSELQSLMRLSYAVFWLTKKKRKNHTLLR